MRRKKRHLALVLAIIMTVTACIGEGALVVYANESTESTLTAEKAVEEAEETKKEIKSDYEEQETISKQDENKSPNMEQDKTQDNVVSSEKEKDKSNAQEISEDKKEEKGESDKQEIDMEAVNKVVNLFKKLPEASEAEKMSEEEIVSISEQAAEAMNAYDALSIKECEYIKEEYQELYKNVMEGLANVLIEHQQDESNPMSLLPLEEVKAYLVLNDKTEEELQNFSVDEMLKMLVDGNGQPVSDLPAGATTVWRYIKDETANVENYEKYSIGKGETIDLSTAKEIHNYHLELIIGSGSQLNSNNVRYIITVYVSKTISEELNFFLYLQDKNGKRTEVIPERTQIAYNNQISGAPVTANEYVVPEISTESQYYLGISSSADEHPNVRTEIYDYFEFLRSYINATPLTDTVLNQNMKQAGQGLQIEYGTPKIFAVVYFDNEDRVISQSFISFAAVKDASYIRADLYQKEGDQLVDVVMLDADHIGFDDLDSLFQFDGIHELYMMLKEGYAADSDLYCVLDAYGVTYGDQANSYVVKAVEGHYDSLTEVEQCKDIKEQLIPADKSSKNRGYKANYKSEDGGVPFTIFFEDGSVWKLRILAMEYDAEMDPDYVKEFTEAPIIGATDPWFRVTGANDVGGKAHDTYVIENGKNINIDTMYGYGYQTVIFNDNVDSFVPTFWKADDEAISIDKIYANGSEFKEGAELSFPEGENTLDATFSVIITDKNGSHPKNYDVTFVKKTSGPQLYVAGPLAPDVRSVFLDEYHENKHDIFIANIGDEPLTNLWLDLDATNVELDDYWSIGGEGNNTLEACPDDFAAELESSDYGELSNVAKIRLVPPSTGKGGEIEGTLKIYSGEEGNAANSKLLATIELSDLAQNPEIITTELDDAVKYVPYSQLITTNNMYDWVNVSYDVIDGELPEGIDLIEETGELYGVPQETGTFKFTVSTEFESTSENYAFTPSTVELTLTVDDNTDDNVYNATDADDNYSILDAIGTEETAGDHHYILEETGDQVFRSEGEMGQFVDVWLNGEKLEPNIDYLVEEGSTRITIKAQTFESNRTNKDGARNTIAAEFRTSDPNSKNDKNNSNELKRTSQNFYMKKHTHSYDSGKVTKAATCKTNGVKTYTCTSCGHQYTEVIKALGHTSDGGQITQNATCTVNGVKSYYCVRCHTLMKTEVIAAPGKHDYKETVTPGKDCVTDGVRTFTCKRCGFMYAEPIKAVGHKYVAEVTIEPTETEDGLKTYTCSVCQDSFTEVIPALGDETHMHTYDEGVATKEPTCLENGMMTYTCTKCGAVKQETILATGHKYKEEIIAEATCTELGTKKFTCEKCGNSYTERIPEKGHNYDKGIVTKQPTAEKTGIKTYTCTICGTSYTEVLPMLNSDLAQGESENSGSGNSGNKAVGSAEETDGVQTGDSANMGIWTALVIMSLGCIIITMYLEKKRQK